MADHAAEIATMSDPGYGSNLKHVYFFVNTAPEHDDAQVETNSALSSNTSTTHQSRSSVPGSMDSTATTATTSTSQSDMNPLAQEFKPRTTSTSTPSPAPAAGDLFELRKTADRGFGLFATSFIKRGTLIICEEPLLQITGTDVHNVWGPYQVLDEAKKAVYDDLHSYACPSLNLEEASRLFLVDPNDNSLDRDDIEKCVAEHVRVMRIFASNNFLHQQSGLTVYGTASRLNHSCVPNVHHSYNPTLKSLTVHAVRDIFPEEELLTTYLGGQAMYTTRAQRAEHLGTNYGFTCHCPACADGTGRSDHIRQLMNNIAWGLTQFNQGAPKNNNFIPDNPATALLQAEDLISLMLTEGIVTIELTKAYRSASTYALQSGNFDKSVEYAHNEKAVEKNCLGTVLDDLVKIGAAADCWIGQVYETIRLQRGEEDVIKDRRIRGFEKKKNKRKTWSKASKAKNGSNGTGEGNGEAKG